MELSEVTRRRWFYPAVFGLFVIISMLPPLTQRPYDPRNTQEVIMTILMTSTAPYRSWGWVFHVATLGLIAWARFRPRAAGRAIAAYFGVNYLLIAAIQTNAETEAYGFAVQTGALVSAVVLGLLWLWVGWRGKLVASFENVPPWRWSLLPLALLAFWAPIGMEGTTVVPRFDPLLLLTSVDYGLAFCFVTPVLLFLLILCHPRVSTLALRVTAVNGLIYGMYNLTHWFNPDRVWMGVMHLPLLIISAVALYVSMSGQRSY
jgi:hypothetical protein